MEGRVDEIGPRFRHRNLQSAPANMSSPTGGNQGFAAFGSGGREDQPASGHDGLPGACPSGAPTQSSVARRPTTLPMTTIAGTWISTGPLAISPSVDTSTDCAGVVALLIIAIGSSDRRPPFSSRLVTFIRCRDAM